MIDSNNSVTITRGQPNNSQGGLIGARANSTGFNFYGNFPNGSRGFVGIRIGNATTGQPGWIDIEVVDVITGKIKIYERGVEATSNTPINSAVTGNCSSMSAVLPVEMTHFHTTPKNQDIHLEWTTASG